MKNKLLLSIATICIVSILSVQSQTLSPTVISSTGGFYTSANAMLSYTVAEMTMVQTFTTSGNILTQGFQQPEDFAVSIPEIPTSAGSVLIYPNPTSGIFTLSYLSNVSSETKLCLYNLVGQVVSDKTVAQVYGLNTINFDISTFSQGIYMLGFTIKTLQGEEKTNYYKVNLVY